MTEKISKVVAFRTVLAELKTIWGEIETVKKDWDAEGDKLKLTVTSIATSTGLLQDQIADAIVEITPLQKIIESGTDDIKKITALLENYRQDVINNIKIPSDLITKFQTVLKEILNVLKSAPEIAAGSDFQTLEKVA